MVNPKEVVTGGSRELVLMELGSGRPDSFRTGCCSQQSRFGQVTGGFPHVPADAVKAAPTTLPELRGVGPVITAIVVGEVRDVARFVDEDHFAAYNGTAPTTWGSAGDARPCVNRGGNRTLNHALHMAAVTQLRNPGPGRDYCQRKIDSGKKPKSALRCLKRRVSDAIYRRLVADADNALGARGSALGDDSKHQRDQPYPYRRLFGEATARAPHIRYAHRGARVLTTEGCHWARTPRSADPVGWRRGRRLSDPSVSPGLPVVSASLEDETAGAATSGGTEVAWRSGGPYL